MQYQNSITVAAMSDDEDLVARSIRLPRTLWESLDREADSSLRSSLKQLEAILKDRYRVSDGPLVTDLLAQFYKETILRDYHNITPTDALTYKHLAAELRTKRAKELAEAEDTDKRKKRERA